MVKFHSKCKHGFAVLLMAGILLSCTKEMPEDSSGGSPAEKSPNEVTIDEAQTQLEKILTELETLPTRGGDAAKPRKIASRFSTGASSTRADGGSEPRVHVFNFENKEGFALMAADDRVTPLLALTIDGELTPETEVDNPGLIVFLSNMDERYRQEIAEREEMNAITKAAGNRIEYGEWYFSQTAPRSYVLWDQHDPYNIYCPIKGVKPALAGCVAIAVAQLMSCYEYPAKYGNYTFDWKEMNKLIKYSYGSTPKPAHSQIARLIQQLGLSKNLAMTYGANSSTAHEANVIRTLRNFGFYKGGTHEKYVGSRIAGEVQKGFPVIITAFDYPARRSSNTTLGIATSAPSSEFGGHCWLMHGSIIRSRSVYTYNASNVLISEKTETVWYFLCNFGWSGQNDGYYLSGAFDLNKDPEYDWDGPFYSRTRTDVPNNFRYNITMNLGIRKTNTDWGYE